MARTFTPASLELITLNLGAGGSLTGASTVAGIFRRATDGTGGTIVCLGNATTNCTSLEVSIANFIRVRRGNVNTLSTSTITAADGWVFVAATKAAGSAAPRFHKYVYNTKTWTRDNSVTSLTDTTPVGNSYLGSRATIAGIYHSGDIAAAGAWAETLTDAQVEALAFSLQPWFRASTNGLWILDQASTGTTVFDLTGKGANQSAITGTTIATSAVPVWNRGAPIITVEAYTAVTPPVTTTASASVFTMAVGRHYGARRSLSVRLPSVVH